MDEYSKKIDSIYAPQEQFINQQIQQLPSMYEPEKMAIEQAKTNAFRDISKEAFKRGRFFGGFQPAEQARYLGEKYLPGLQQLTLAQQQAKQGLLGKLIDLQTGRSKDKLTYAEQLRQEGVAATRDEQQFQRSLALQRASSRGGGGGGGSSGSEDLRRTINDIGSFLQSRVGKDGKVSPTTFQQGRQAWVAAGGDPGVYANTFFGYVNKTHQKDYF